MGYYTDYTLSVYGMKRENGIALLTSDIPSIVEEQIEDEIEKMNIFSDGDIKNSCYAYTTWYDHEEDMRLLSAKFPDNVFWLSGHGDNSEDLWQKFFVGGRMQASYARIIYDDFDANQLDDGMTDDVAGKKYSYQTE